MIRKIAQLRLSPAGVIAFPAVVNWVSAVRCPRFVAAAFLSVSALMVSTPAQSTPLIDFASATLPLPIISDFTLGYRFKALESASIDGLGVFNFLLENNPDDLNYSHEVGLWKLTESGEPDGTVEPIFATVQPDSTFREDSKSGLGEYVYASLDDPITLVPGMVYILGASYELTDPGFPSQDLAIFLANNISSDSLRVEYLFAQSGSNNGKGIVFPNISDEGQMDRYFGPALHVTAIPEPATLTLLVLALTCMMFGRRPMRKISPS